MRNRMFIVLGALTVGALCVIVGCIVVLVSMTSLGQFFLPNQLEQVQATLEAVATTAPQVVATTAPQTGATAVATKAPGLPTLSAPGANAGNPFTDALSKAKTATKYRVQFAWIFGGMQDGKYSEQPFMDFSGVVDGAKSQMSSKGGILAMLAGDEKATVEIISADGKTYMKGVNMFGLADPKQWYITDDSSTSGFADFAKPDEYKDWLGGSNASDYKKVRTENLDGQSCDVYLWDMKSLQNAAIIGILGSAQDKNDFSAVDKGEMNFWLCKDGFVHQFVLDYQGHDAKDATQKAALKMSWHAWDFNNAAISVTVPKDAKPMPGR
ncbi:MAG: hypothetical protein HY782_03520 [Chloroflexi bacterium]|nr:hypothetical protein [Chloroflexota bacterium]